MTAASPTATIPSPLTRLSVTDLGGVRGRRRATNAVITVLMGTSVVVIALVLLLVLWTVVSKGWSIVAGQFPAW
ncbi:MAG TPA: hypothetical protein PLV68_06730, partial [Ilumatobacteraceae bacterium]|nr:hypothetical protein [Ilumatobacteraceae bacterium]